MILQKNIRFIMIILLMIGTPLSIVNASDTDSSLIDSYEDDITGDGFRENIKMEGRLLSENSSFYQKIWIDVQNKFKKQWSISLQNGYDPKLTLIDFNHDQTFDLFYEIKKDNDQYSYQLYTLKSNKVKSLPIPKRLYTQGEFADDFKVNIRLDPHKNSNSIDMKDKKSHYIQKGIYDEDGNLLKNVETQIDPISKLEPVLISKSKGYGLKSVQKINGAEKDDVIGTLETLWHLKKDKWIIVKSEIKT